MIVELAVAVPFLSGPAKIPMLMEVPSSAKTASNQHAAVAYSCNGHSLESRSCCVKRRASPVAGLAARMAPWGMQSGAAQWIAPASEPSPGGGVPAAW
jgi:hypothetical protein